MDLKKVRVIQLHTQTHTVTHHWIKINKMMPSKTIKAERYRPKGKDDLIGLTLCIPMGLIRSSDPPFPTSPMISIAPKWVLMDGTWVRVTYIYCYLSNLKLRKMVHDVCWTWSWAWLHCRTRHHPQSRKKDQQARSICLRASCSTTVAWEKPTSQQRLCIDLSTTDIRSSEISLKYPGPGVHSPIYRMQQ